MRFALSFTSHDANGRPVSDVKWTRLIVELNADTGALEPVAFWRGYDSLLKCADTLEDIKNICAYMLRAAKIGTLVPVSVTSRFNYDVTYA